MLIETRFVSLPRRNVAQTLWGPLSVAIARSNFSSLGATPALEKARRETMLSSSTISLSVAHSRALPLLASYPAVLNNVFPARTRGSLIHTFNCWRQAGFFLRHFGVSPSRIYVLRQTDRQCSPLYTIRHRPSPSFRLPRDTPLRLPFVPFVQKRRPIMANVPPQLSFTNDVASMDEWSRRTGIPLTTADALGTNYARARRWLLSIRSKLVQEHGWQDVTPLDSRLLFDIECPTPYRSSRGLPRSPNMRLQIPVNASSFFSRERRVQWEMVFHSALFPGLRHTVPAIADLLHLLQCLLTGMIVLIKEEQVPGEGMYRTIRGLPPVEWVTGHEAALVDIFGSSHYRQLFRAASDNRVAFKLERA